MLHHLASQFVTDLDLMIDAADDIEASAREVMPKWWADEDASRAVEALEEASEALRKARLVIQRINREED